MSDQVAPFFAIPMDRGHRHGRLDGQERTVQLVLEPPIDSWIGESGVPPTDDGFVRIAAALGVLIFRYSRQPIIVIGVPDSGDGGLANHDPVVLPMRISIGSQDTFEALIAKTAASLSPLRNRTQGSGSTMEPGRDSDSAATHLVLSVRTVTGVAPVSGFDASPCLDTALLAASDLLVDVVREGARTIFRLTYDGRRFSKDQVDRLAAQIVETLKSVSSDAAKSVKDIEILPRSERHRLLVELNGESAPRPDKTVIDLIEEQCARSPSRPAYLCDGDVLTYEQANGKANSLSLDLHRMGVVKGDFVPLVLGQSLDLVISAFALMKLGAAFVPVDTTWPAARIQKIIEELSPRVVLADGDFQSGGDGRFPVHIVDAALLPPSSTGHRNPVSTDDTIYGYFTSGSTGVPKCAVNLHRGIVNRFLYMTKRYQADGSEIILQNSKPAFDAWVWQVFWPLTNGARVVMPRSPKVFDMLRTIELIERHQVTITDFVPSVFNVLVNYITEVNPAAQRQIRTLRHILIGGEELNPAAVYRFKTVLPEVGLTNTYGPTEASIGTIFFEIGAQQYARLPIGRPIDNVSALLLDEDLNLVPSGVVGEIFLGGACVGSGYYKDPARTRTVFVDNPYPEVGSAHIYRTGDLAYHRPDGDIQFLGRKDAQVKLRGVRIELGEIEATLLQLPEVTDAKVLLDSRVAGHEELIAFLVCKGTNVDVRAIRDHVRGQIPIYMVPTHILVLDAFPLDHNGKADRKRLLQDFASTAATQPADLGGPEAARLDAEDSISAPHTPIEMLVFSLWQKALKTDRIEVNDNFFDLGGHSLALMPVIAEIQAKLGVRLTADEFALQTLGQIAATCEERQRHVREAEPVGLLRTILSALRRKSTKSGHETANSRLP